MNPDSDGGSFEKHPVDDNSLMFVFQSKLFNIQADYDTEKFLRAVMFLDAHMEPYYDRWPTRRPHEYEVLWELPIPEPNSDIVMGYADRRDMLYERYMRMKSTGEKKMRFADGKIITITMKPEQIDYEWATEWYRLIRLLFLRMGVLPKGYVEDEIR